MGVNDRLATRLLRSTVPLERAALEVEARKLLRVEAPLAGPGAASDVVDGLIGANRTSVASTRRIGRLGQSIR